MGKLEYLTITIQPNTNKEIKIGTKGIVSGDGYKKLIEVRTIFKDSTYTYVSDIKNDVTGWFVQHFEVLTEKEYKNELKNNNYHEWVFI